jgi:hypothetical protein
VRVDEEATVFELKEVVKKTLVNQKAQWAMVLSDWGVYLPHQTDGYFIYLFFSPPLIRKFCLRLFRETLLEDDTPIVSTVLN